MAENEHSLLERRRETMVGVVDIGSNSLRLVIYDGVSRAPHLLLNEKVMCALGRGMNVTGRLNPEGVILAYDNIERFAALVTQLGVKELDVLATSAVRDATDGPAFVKTLRERFGIDVQVVAGEEEARLAAAGIEATTYEPEGIVGDLGGGSVELASVGAKHLRRYTSLPIGPVRLLGEVSDDPKLRIQIDEAIARLDWLSEGRGKTFYAVGGAWRALSRIHMEQTNYPLHVIQGYRLPRGEADTFLGVIGRQSRRSLDKMTGISKKRLETLPLASYVLYRLIRAIEPSEIFFSAYGLREGHLFLKLPESERAEDTLLFAAAEMGRAHPRFGGGGAEMTAWTDPLFYDDDQSIRRLRQAAALLSDIAWDEHPDYRTEQAFMRMLRMPMAGIDHADRVFIATVLHARYGGNAEAPELRRFQPLLDPKVFARARAVGHAFRLVHTLTGGAPGLIQRTSITADAQTLTLSVPDHSAVYTGETVRRRLDTLARALGKRPSFDVESGEEIAVRRQA